MAIFCYFVLFVRSVFEKIFLQFLRHLRNLSVRVKVSVMVSIRTFAFSARHKKGLAVAKPYL